MPRPRFPLVTIMLGNATLLSSIYLLLAIAIELVRRLSASVVADNLSRAVERLPARALERVGLMVPLARAYFQGELSELVLRLLLGATTVVIIFTMALLVGAGLWAVRAALRPRAS